MDELCRLCLKKSDLIDVFSVVGVGRKIAENLLKFLNKNIYPEDNWPKTVCIYCAHKLEEFRIFLGSVEINEKLLEIQFGPLENEKIDENDEDKIQATAQEVNYIVEDVDLPLVEVLNDEIREETEIDEEEKSDLQNEDQQLDEEISENESNNSENKDTEGQIAVSKIQTKTPRQKEDEKIANFFNLRCEVCNETFPRFLDLNSHYKLAHKMEGYVKCCDKKFDKRFKILQHIEFHLEPRIFTCNICGKVMKNARLLKSHLDIHAPTEAKIFKCEKCPKTFLRSWKLDKHIIIHSGEKNFNCPSCEKRFLTSHLMQNHIRNIHENKYVRICDICAKVYRNKDSFDRHQLEHEGKKPDKVECSICGKFYSTKYKLTQHIKIHHNDPNTSYKCGLCEKIAPNQRALQTHISYVHTNKRNHQCLFCDKSFRRPKELKEHTATHTGALLYNCSFCPKQFKSNANMYVHQKNKHPEDWAKKKLKAND